MSVFWWFICGILVGWLLNWLLARYFAPVNAPTPAAQAFVAPPVAAMPPKVQGLDVAAAAAVGIIVKGDDDLCMVEGIGPKISQLLKDNGIPSLRSLSQKTPEELGKILEAAGSRYKLANPSTWAMQAGLAAENRWPELKALQDELIGGVFPDDLHHHHAHKTEKA